MPDYPTPPTSTSTPLAQSLNAAEIDELLATLERIPREELPDGAARDALEEAILSGDVDALYTPVGHPYHNVCLASLPADVDPRVTVAQWRKWWDAGKSPSDELLAEHRRRATREDGDA